MSLSAIVAVRDGERYLGAALASLIAQTRPPDEIVVVDDGSTDGSAAIAAGFPGVTVLRRAHEGAPAARNAGIVAARGDMLTFLDGDDLAPPERFERQLAALDEDPGLAMVFGAVRNFVSPDRRDELGGRLTAPAVAAAAPRMAAMSARREAFDRVGLLDPDLRLGDFPDWMRRAGELGLRWAQLPELAVLRRIHGDNASLRDDIRAGYARAAFLAIQRHRASS